ncbi:MAG: ABC transporter ATP-binding protein [Magnetococcales bacterium]|nr:ABC transporter ATP-binding protein [Magnetococcales bacterium]
MMPLLSVAGLEVGFDLHGGVVQAVRGVDLQVAAGQTLAIVGESGCGKSASMLAVMGLISSPPGRVTAQSLHLAGRDILHLSPAMARGLRGVEMAMIFQDPMSALHPTMRIGAQIAEPLQVHLKMGRVAAWRRAEELLDMTGITDVARRLRQYPFEFSGGMLQRVLIAMSLACQPRLLIADEPTTALDVTIQAQILDLLASLQRDRGMALILITHDLGVVARMADFVAVMYAGQVVESGPVAAIFATAAHPYTLGLHRAIPDLDPLHRHPPQPIDGSPPDLFAPPVGCGFYARCPQAMRACREHMPELLPVGDNHVARCWLHHPLAPRLATCQPAGVAP